MRTTILATACWLAIFAYRFGSRAALGPIAPSIEVMVESVLAHLRWPMTRANASLS